METSGVFYLTDTGPIPIVSVQRHKGTIRALGFAHVGGRAFSQSYDQLRVWDLRTDDLLDAAALAVGRNISEPEWQAYFPGQAYRKTFRNIAGGR
jgi:hypothetical protein